MGLETSRCLQVGELRKALRRFDGDLLVRFRDGKVTYPGIYVMRDDGTDHLDLGSPYPVRERVAKVARTVRRVDRRKKEYGIKAYGKWHRFATEDEYRKYLLEWMRNSEGAERDRPVNAICALQGGKKEYDSDRRG